MARFDPIASSFSSGEISQLLMGRVDIAKYQNGVDTLENFLIMLQGGITRRPGTRYIATTKDSTKASRLLPFQYSADQDYVVEMGDEYMRFFSNDADAINVTEYDSYTKFLSHFNGADGAVAATDEIGKVITFGGTAQLDTAYKKFGTASLLLDGDSDYISVPDSTDWDLGSGDFTIDMWIRKGADNVSGDLIQHGTAANNFEWYFKDPGADQNKINFDMGVSGNLLSTSTITGTDLHHIAIVRYGNTLTVYIDGVTDGTKDMTGLSIPANAGTLYVGAYKGASTFYNGHIDELRVSKGVARWTTDFTPPTSEYVKITSLVELASPYLEADIFEVQQAHKGDLKYLTHGDYFPRILSRTDATTFGIDVADIKRGPFLDTNVTAALTITPSADTGAGITLTAAAPGAFHYDADDGDPDEQLQVGSLWRIKSGVVKILTVVSATEATADVQAEPDGTAGDLDTGPGATADWAEGAFSGYRGYPAVCAFHDGRLYYASTEYEPQKIWGSVIYDYDNFDAGDGTDDADAVTFEIATEERVAIRWMLSGNKALSIGSTGGTFSAYGTANAPITASDIQVNRDTNYGAALFPSKRISSFSYYIQRNLHKIRELSYYYDYDVTRATDMTMLAEHILRDGLGVVDWDYQQSPNDRLWCVRSDGQLAVLTRNPEQDVMGWSRIIAGTDSTSEGEFESVCVIPKQNADDQVWVVTKRKVAGVTKRFIEFFTTENFDEDWDAICLDASLTLDSPKIITGMTNASPGVFTCASHGFTGGEQVKINDVILGNVSGAASTEINGTYLLVYINTTTFSLTTLAGVAINTTTALGYGTYVSGGEIREMVTNVTGLSHLEGETVQVTADNAVPTTNSFVITSGTLVPALTTKAAVVHVGLPYTPYMKTLRPEGGSQVGTAQGKIKRIPKITARFYRTGDCKIGPAARQDRFSFTDIYTGDKELPVPMSSETDSQLIVTSDKPLPLTLISLMPKIAVGDDN